MEIATEETAVAGAGTGAGAGAVGGAGGVGGGSSGGGGQGFFHRPRLPYYQKTQVYKHHHYINRQSDGQPSNATNFDGKRMRKSVSRKTVDYNTSVVRLLETRIWQRDKRDMRWIQPDMSYLHEMGLPCSLRHNPINAVTTKFVRTSTNKVRCPIFCAVWTPEGRRLVTGASSGEFTLWNGLTFNFETILQAHDYPVRTMTWSHNDLWLLTADHLGYVKYWQSNMNNVKMYQAHKDNPIRGTSFSPTDSKFATCSDDGTVRIYDFLRCHEERIMRGHGADVRAVDWHPQKGIVVSGSKDSQQPIKLWDPRTGNSLATLHAHKNTVMGVKWNMNGNWLLTASRDHLCKLYDIRTLKEMYIFRGHKKEATAISWHPIHEDMFVSGGSDGSLLFWQIGNDKEVGGIESAHDSIVWSLAWHPLGHILCSGSNDHSIKFWTRNRPGDRMRDRYNLNTLPIGTSEEMLEYDDDFSAGPVVPGLGLELGLPGEQKNDDVVELDLFDASIPGLDSSAEELARLKPQPQRKVPYAKPINEEFQKNWDKLKAPGIAPQVKEERPYQYNGPPGDNDFDYQAMKSPMRWKGPGHINNKPPQDKKPMHMPPPQSAEPRPFAKDAEDKHQTRDAEGTQPNEQRMLPHSQGPPHGSPHGPPHGPPHGQPQGPPHGPPHEQPQGPPQGPPHGPPQGRQRGPPHGQAPKLEPPGLEQPVRHPSPQMGPRPGVGMPPGPRIPGGPRMQPPRPVLHGQPAEPPSMPGNQQHPLHQQLHSREPMSGPEPPGRQDPPDTSGPPSLMSLQLGPAKMGKGPTGPPEPPPGDRDFRRGTPPPDNNQSEDIDLRRQFGSNGGGDVDLRNRFRDQDLRPPQFSGNRDNQLPDEDLRNPRHKNSPGPPRGQEGDFDPFLSGDTDLRQQRGPPGRNQPPMDQDLRQGPQSGPPGRFPPNTESFPKELHGQQDHDDRFGNDPLQRGDTDFRKFPPKEGDDFVFDNKDQDLRFHGKNTGPNRSPPDQGGSLDVDLRRGGLLPTPEGERPPQELKLDHDERNRFNSRNEHNLSPMHDSGEFPAPQQQKRPWDDGPGEDFGDERREGPEPWAAGVEMGDRGRGRGGFQGRGGRGMRGGRGGFGRGNNDSPGFRGNSRGRGPSRGGRGMRGRGRPGRGR